MLLILGLLASLAAAGLIGMLFVAFWTVRRFAGSFISSFMKPGVDVEEWEYVFTLAVTGFGLAIAGPESISFDAAIGIAHALDGWAGLIITLAGLGVSFAQITMYWRPTEAEPST